MRNIRTDEYSNELNTLMMTRNILTSLIYLGCFIILIGCQSTTEKTGDFMILPAPQQFEISGISTLGGDDIQSYFSEEGTELPFTGALLKDIRKAESSTQAQVVIRLDADIDVKPEGYMLDITSKRITITGKDQAGLLYGFMTLEQMLEDAKGQGVNLPQCSIKDYPLLAYRAIHIDIKHHRETLEYYYQLMDRLAKFKVNAIIAEVEDKLGYVRQPKVASADALSIEEWKKLSDYAQKRNIEISPLVQGLGHASFILKHDKYKDLRDDPESDWAFNPLDPRTYEVQFDLYLDAIEATPHGKYLHVGGDEVHTTGRNSGKSALELQLDWLDKVCKFAAEQNRIPIFWDDMPLKHAKVYGPMFNRKISQQKVDSIWAANAYILSDFIDQFPKNCIYMRWNYQTPETYGNLKAMDWFTSNGFQTMGATAGQTRWTLMPQNESNISNIKSFALSSIEKGLDGLLLTLWDDDSPHFELYIRGIMAFAEYSWAGDQRSKEAFKEAHSQRAFGYSGAEEFAEFIDALEEPVGAWKNALVKKGKRRNGLIAMDSPLSEGILDMPNPKQKGSWTEQNADRLAMAREMLKICDSVSMQINKAKKAAKRNQYTLEIYEQVNALVQFSFQSLLALESYDTNTQAFDAQETFSDLEELEGKFKSLRAQFEEVYAKTRILNKPEGYILDQDHHLHSANQTTNFDWQFVSELLLLEKMKTLK